VDELGAIRQRFAEELRDRADLRSVAIIARFTRSSVWFGHVGICTVDIWLGRRMDAAAPDF
jgi:hypothetical protein